MSVKWIDAAKKLPPKPWGGELVEFLAVLSNRTRTAVFWNGEEFCDTRDAYPYGGGEHKHSESVLYWSEFPDAPKPKASKQGTA